MHLNLGKCRVHLTPMLKPCGFYGVLKGAVENVSDFLPLMYCLAICHEFSDNKSIGGSACFNPLYFHSGVCFKLLV